MEKSILLWPRAELEIQPDCQLPSRAKAKQIRERVEDANGVCFIQVRHSPTNH